jgi:hypothetical protein
MLQEDLTVAHVQYDTLMEQRDQIYERLTMVEGEAVTRLVETFGEIERQDYHIEAQLDVLSLEGEDIIRQVDDRHVMTQLAVSEREERIRMLFEFQEVEAERATLAEQLRQQVISQVVPVPDPLKEPASDDGSDWGDGASDGTFDQKKIQDPDDQIGISLELSIQQPHLAGVERVASTAAVDKPVKPRKPAHLASISGAVQQESDDEPVRPPTVAELMAQLQGSIRPQRPSKLEEA